MTVELNADGSAGTIATPSISLDGLSDSTRRLLNGQYGGKSIPQALMSSTHGMIGTGKSLREITTYFQASDVVLAQHLRAFYSDDLSAEIETAFVRAEERRSSHTQACDQARGIAAEWCRGGRKASSALAVLFGLYDIADAAGALSFTTSIRAIGEAAGVGSISYSGRTSNQATVMSGLATLIKLNLADVVTTSPTAKTIELGQTQVRLKNPAQMREAIVEQTQTLLPLRLCTPKIDSVTPRERGERVIKINGTKSCIPIGANSTWRHVIWENAALGMTASRVWHLALQQPDLNRRQLAAHLNISRQATEKQLSKLADAGLYDTANSRPIELDETRLDQVAAHFGVGDRRATRAAINAENRTDFINFLRSERTPQVSSPSSAQVGASEVGTLLGASELRRGNGGLLVDPGFGPFDGPGDEPTPVVEMFGSASSEDRRTFAITVAPVTVVELAPVTTTAVQKKCRRAVEAQIARFKASAAVAVAA